jgi:hypothetical protein
MVNEKQRLAVKINYYFEKRLPCHLKIKPVGHVDGFIISDIIDDVFIWFRPHDTDTKKRIFLVDIHDLKDYEVRIREDVEV